MLICKIFFFLKACRWNVLNKKIQMHFQLENFIFLLKKYPCENLRKKYRMKLITFQLTKYGKKMIKERNKFQDTIVDMY
jgi:hypothetical protein